MTNYKELYFKKKPEDFIKFSEKILCARINYYNGKNKKRGLSLVAASKKIGITPMYLSLLENEKRILPNSIILYKVESVYGFKHGELAEVLITENQLRKKNSSSERAG
ncbi:MAG: helix-turn-helix domain-containing protein [Clostridia bacterium]|nr:helix-turn-helix domain-containing protein [Clostridia bacterium]